MRLQMYLRFAPYGKGWHKITYQKVLIDRKMERILLPELRGITSHHQIPAFIYLKQDNFFDSIEIENNFLFKNYHLVRTIHFFSYFFRVISFDVWRSPDTIESIFFPPII